MLGARAVQIKGPVGIKISIKGHEIFLFLFRAGTLATHNFKHLKDRGEYRKLLVVVMVWGGDRWELQQITDYVGVRGWRNGAEWKTLPLGAGKGSYIILLTTTILCWLHPFHFWLPLTGPFLPSISSQHSSSHP